MKKIIFVILIFAFNLISAQTKLNEGDIAIISVNNSNESFDFVTFVDLRPGTVIYFTDRGWDGSEFVTNEKTIMFSTDSLIRYGSIFSTEFDGRFFNNEYLLLNNSGENIIAYQMQDSQYKFLYGIAWGSTNQWISSGTPNSSNSFVPSGLSKSRNTIVQLGKEDNYQYNSLSVGTKETLLITMNNTSNWSSSSTPFGKSNLTFEIQGLSPLFYFMKDNAKINESAGSISFDVTVSYPSRTDNMQVDVILNIGNSSADNSDFIGSLTKTIFFPANSYSNRNVDFEINDDLLIENTETCWFELKNPEIINSSLPAFIDSPHVFTAQIIDSEVPDIIINELLPAPNSDVNNDGITSNDDEFIELINNCGIDYYFDSLEIHDAKGATHIFPANTLVPADQAIVIFSGGNPQNIPCITQVSSEGTLSLNNTGDNIKLFGKNGVIIDQFEYSGSSNDISWARSPDITGNFLKHTNIASNPVHYTPGRKNFDGQPLPVELLYFRGKYENEVIIFNLETATEINNYGFEIQESIENKWEKIAFLKGHGNSNSSKFYSYSYPVNVLNKNYMFRLKQIDFNGNYEILDTLKIFASVTFQSFSLKTYPNPFNNISNLELRLDKPGQLKIEFYNVTGQRVFNTAKNINYPGVYTFNYNFKNLSSGFYIYRIDFNGEKRYLKTALIK